VASFKSFEVQSNRTFLSPVSKLDEFLNLPPLITMLLSFDRTVIRLAEGMFGIADYFCDRIDGFSHNDVFPFVNEFQAGEVPRGREGEPVSATALISTTLELMVEV
jgi:hypothetical protein